MWTRAKTSQAAARHGMTLAGPKLCPARLTQLRGQKDKPNTAYHAKASQLAMKAWESADWTSEEKAAAADAIEQWHPRIVAVHLKEMSKKLKLATLRTP